MKIEFTCDGSTTDQLTNINVAKSLIEHETIYFNEILKRDTVTATFEVEDLEEIANHIMVYCKAERIRQGYTEEQNK